MGFFSAVCVGCDHSLLCSQATTCGVNEWMSECVAVRDNRVVAVGQYDGYGSIGETLNAIDNASCWHAACWEVAGYPVVGTPVSKNAQDQGWFFSEGVHDLPDPRLALSSLRVVELLASSADNGLRLPVFAVVDDDARVYGIYLEMGLAAAQLKRLRP